MWCREFHSPTKGVNRGCLSVTISKFRPSEMIFSAILEKSFRDCVIFSKYSTTTIMNAYYIKARNLSVAIDVTRKYFGL